MGIGVVIIAGGNSRKHGKKGTRLCVPFGFVVLWQAWRTPASLGFSLSVPAACGCHEIDHLKASPLPDNRITNSQTSVKIFSRIRDYWELLGSNFRIVTEAAPERAAELLLKVRVNVVWEGA